MDLSKLRNEYLTNGLHEKDMKIDPFKQFAHWFKIVRDANLIEPNTMILSTVGDDLMPHARAVLLKKVNEEGFVFFTNYKSLKGSNLKDNAKASLLFLWLDLSRQVRIEGVVKRTSREESEKYFQSRPLGSQLGAWTSPLQSGVLESREKLEEEFLKVSEKFKGLKKLPLPPFWGGYILKPIKFEFWQGRENRLHDRFVYQKTKNKKNPWKILRLYP